MKARLITHIVLFVLTAALLTATVNSADRPISFYVNVKSRQAHDHTRLRRNVHQRLRLAPKWAGQDSDVGNGRMRKNCIWVRGHVFCDNGRGKHNGETAIVQLIDPSVGRLDEAYSSRNGYFQVYGCSADSFARTDPEVAIIHTCKSAQPRSLMFYVPYTNREEMNVTDVINLNAYFSTEIHYLKDVRKPCDPY